MNPATTGHRVAAALMAVASLSSCAHAAKTPTASTTSAPPETSAAAPVISTTAPAAAPTTTPARTTTWTALQPGDCLAEPPPSDPAVVDVTIVDCTGPHLAETFLRVGIPVDAALTGNANAQCQAGLAKYTAGASGGGGYTISYLIDSDQDRTSNNPLPSTVICLLQSAGGQALTGSARG